MPYGSPGCGKQVQVLGEAKMHSEEQLSHVSW